ncbi:uncharacterized protein LOC131849845 [Achroia grisella]|uniref:uncharacterized protein LOC131849845 n=1 Tax=Achroia grisella TaxID=688607 RepID=UPI0027D22B60|nr:uncharacterized protein LOC131849845 [Achroia grisella]
MKGAKIIMQIKKRPVIWNRSYPTHSNKQMVAAAWRAIKKVLKISVKKLKEEWKDMNEKHLQELIKEIKYKAKCGRKRDSKWANYKLMDFMKKELLPRTCTCQQKKRAIAKKRNNTKMVRRKEVTTTVRHREKEEYS